MLLSGWSFIIFRLLLRFTVFEYVCIEEYLISQSSSDLLTVYHTISHMIYCVMVGATVTRSLKGKTGVIVEESYRFEVFKMNMAKVKIIQQAEQATAVYGATQFADMTG